MFVQILMSADHQKSTHAMATARILQEAMFAYVQVDTQGMLLSPMDAKVRMYVVVFAAANNKRPWNPTYAYT